MQSPARRLDVCLISYPYHSSKTTGRGHDRYLAELAENLASADVDVRLVDQGFSRGALAAAQKLAQLGAELARARAHVYHAISPLGGAAAVLMGKSPLVVTIHDLIPFHFSEFDYSWKYRSVRGAARLCVRKAAAVIVPYQVTKDEIVARMGGDPHKIHVVNYGVDHAAYFPQSELPRDERRILYVGEVSQSKGVDVLIRAFAIVKQKIPEATLVIGGKPSRDQASLEALARGVGVTNLDFVGFVREEELPAYYSQASVMVFPSRYGFGLSTLEAMACGTPVIVAASLDAPEFMADFGMIAKPDDAADLALHITRILSEPELRRKFSEKAVARAAQFSWAEMARGTREVYARVLGI